ncbi:short transient receptor potential channel 6a isoform X2 [Lates japonicus]|uniref:Short transient receptor potential channel 6a isoform X2 n=1 Tax=Lates japonicus TaxID=270547 RepID=A0AAD3M6F5_LATJO|nr:short transient receptor potential channel 6a isoform X2 [Lates japonicus]
MAHRGLGQSCLPLLSSEDPVLAALELSNELATLANIEKEFKRTTIAVCPASARTCGGSLDLCRAEEFVAHPNCQQQLLSIWYENRPVRDNRPLLSNCWVVLGVAIGLPGLASSLLDRLLAVEHHPAAKHDPPSAAGSTPIQPATVSDCMTNEANLHVMEIPHHFMGHAGTSGYRQIPSLVSEGLVAQSLVLSFSRIAYILPPTRAGPLQISLQNCQGHLQVHGHLHPGLSMLHDRMFNLYPTTWG